MFLDRSVNEVFPSDVWYLDLRPIITILDVYLRCYVWKFKSCISRISLMSNRWGKSCRPPCLRRPQGGGERTWGVYCNLEVIVCNEARFYFEVVSLLSIYMAISVVRLAPPVYLSPFSSLWSERQLYSDIESLFFLFFSWKCICKIAVLLQSIEPL